MNSRATFFSAIIAFTALVAAASPACAVALTTTTTAPAPLICIDPGHGGPFSNANENGLHERTVNLQIGLALRKRLLARGFRVIMTRTTNSALELGDISTWNLGSHNLWSYARDFVRYKHDRIPKDDLTARASVADQAGADLFISIHNNAAASHSVHGTEVWASVKDRLGKKLSPYVAAGVHRHTGLKNRGTRSADFYVCRWTNMPAILVECAYISNNSDARKLKSSSFRGRIADGIADGVSRWFATKPYQRTMARYTATSQAGAARALSRSTYTTGAATVLVVRSNRASDTPGAPALAMRIHAPLLQSTASVPETATLAEIGRLHPSRVLLVGLRGSFDVSATAAALQPYGITTPTVSAVEATDRATLSGTIALKMGAPGSGRIAIVNARDEAAYMALVPEAARTRMAILLTTDTSATAAAAYIAAKAPYITKALLVGSKYRPAYVGTGTAMRQTLQYSDSVHIAYVLETAAFRWNASGALYPLVVNSAMQGDLFTASMRAAAANRPVILIRRKVLSPYMRLFITNRRTKIRSFTLVDSGNTMSPLVDAIMAKCNSRKEGSDLNESAIEPAEGIVHRRLTSSDVELEVDDVAVSNDVVLPF